MRFQYIEYAMRDRNTERITRVRSAGEDGAVGGEHSHHVFTSAEGRNRKSASENFPDRGEVGTNSGSSLFAAHSRARPRDDFVEDQQCAGSIGEPPQAA